MKHPYVPPFDRPVFDNSRSGLRMMAERQDEPGMELVGFGEADLNAELLGDWSWKPWRYRQDPGRVLDAAEIEELRFNERYSKMGAEAQAQFAKDNIDPETGIEIRNLRKSLLPRGGYR